MAIKASSTITLSFMVDVKAVYRYYKLQSSTLSAPAVPTTNPPSGWEQAEPTYTSGSTNTLYTVDLTVFTNDTWLYTPVSKSSSYEAAKDAYNKAALAQNAASSAQDTANTANNKIDGLQIGGRNLLLDTNKGARNWGISKANGDYKITDYNYNGTNIMKLTCTTPSTSYAVLYYNNINRTSLKTGATYTLSFDAKASVQADLSVSYRGSNGSNHCAQFANKISLSSDWKHYTLTTTFNSTNPNSGQVIYIDKIGVIGDYYFANMKLELGNKATDYTEAPEDVQAAIDDAKNTATSAQTSANGKNTVFYLDGKNNSSGKPTVVPTGTTECPLKTNDLWFNTGEGNCSYRWNGSQWERKAYGNAAIDTLDAGKITTGQMDAARISVTDLSAFRATIGGFSIRDGAVYSTNVGMGRNGKEWAFWAGSDTSGSSPFKVGHNGTLYATNATITGSISGSSITGSTITGSTITSTDGNGIIKLDNTELTFGAIGEDDAQIKIYLDNKGQAAIDTPWFKSTKNADQDILFSGTCRFDNIAFSKVNGDAKFNNDVYVGYQTLPEKNVCFENTTATSGSTNRASHKTKIYGANANSTTALGAWDYKNNHAIWIYQDGAKVDGTTVSSKTLSVNSNITFTATGTVSSSDERLKHDFKPLDRYEGFFYDLKPGSFKYDNGNSERDWIGAKAQDVEKALVKNGLTTKDFAGYVQYNKTETDDDWHGYEDEKGLRYENFIFLNTHMIQKQHKEIETLKEELANVKSELEDIKKLLKGLAN